MKNNEYRKTVDLLLRILPFILKDKRIALKGGTAINLFHQDFPRLSVDIDLCYLPLEDRTTTFKNLHEILANIKFNLEKTLGLSVVSNVPLDGKREVKINVIEAGVEVKIEPNFILRSTLFPVIDLDLSDKAQVEFERFVSARCLSLADVYGGKICAALDRQHPRDLFDIKYLLDHEGITLDIKDSFIYYLISHNRPVDELLNPNFKDINAQYKEEFFNMVYVNVELDELIVAREKLVNEIKSLLTVTDKDFLISFVSNNTDWSKVRDSKIKDYPSVKWKLMNQEKMSRDKHEKYIEAVKKILGES